MSMNTTNGRKTTALKMMALTSTALVGLTFSPAAMAQSTWKGGSETWFDATNWTPNQVPTASDDVTIDEDAQGSPRISGAGHNAQAKKIVIGDSADGTLNVQDAGTLTSTQGVIGNLVGSNGNVNIGQVANGTVSYWTNSGNLVIGSSGSGGLYIGAGTVSNSDATIGANAGSLGYVGVNGAIATWTNSGSLTIGGAGSATLNILNGGMVNVGSVGSIGELAGSVGTLSVSGSGSSWASNNLTVGNFGTGTLDIRNGGVASNTRGRIASHNGSAGAVTVDGVGSIWTNTAELTIGGNGDGTLKITNGAKVQDTAGIIADLEGTSSVMVSDAGSTWNNSSTLTIGAGGHATLSILKGGSVSVGSSGSIGELAGSVGTLSVSGSGSSWTSNNLTVGNFGTGTLDIRNGGVASNTRGRIASHNGSAGDVTVDGVGSIWTNTAELTIGGNGDGTLKITNGAKVQDTAGIIADLEGTSSVMVSDAGSTWINSGALTIGSAGAGSLFIQGGGSVSNADVGKIGALAGANGTASVDGVGSIWLNQGILFIGDSGNGTLNITNSGVVEDFVGALAVSDPAAKGTVTVDGAGSQWTNYSATIIGVTGNGSLTVTNAGKVITGATVAGAGATVGSSNLGVGTATVDGGGSLWAVSGDLTVGFDGKGTLSITNGGLVSIGGALLLAKNAGSTGDLNIGAGSAAGALDALAVNFGAGTGRINFNHTSTNYSFDAAISGLGTINQNSGVTRLTADSSAFTGLTHVTGGTLLVDGKLGTGAVDVQNGGTLGGGGSIGGTVTVASGGTLSGFQGKTLTMQSLLLTSGATIDATFSSPLGATLFNVTGDLTLDGTLNLTAGGAFGPGIYSLMTYGGSLTDNGLNVGSTPNGSVPSDYLVQTSIAGQVNLINNSLPNLSFWDGDAAGSANNNQVNGGSGIWTATSTNWTDANGTTNGILHPQPGFAIFAGPAGIVTVDESAGPINVTGMQFASDGYLVTGGAVGLADPNSIIRVGDGSAAGADFTTVITSKLTGEGGLNKTDLGTLILTGDNDYSGGTKITDGALQIGAGGTTGSVIGDIQADGTLIFKRSDNVTFAGSISGGGSFVQFGAGTLTLSGNSSGFTGYALFDTGGVAITGGGKLGANTVNVGSSPNSVATLTVSGAGSSLNSTGSLFLGESGSGTLNVTNGGVVSDIQAAMGASAGASGKAIVDGAGSTWTTTTNLALGVGGNGSLTVTNGGVVIVGGRIFLAIDAGSTGVLNIGSAQGLAATGAGTLSTGAIQFGDGAGTINFNHTGTNYVFGAPLLGNGTLNQLAGNTSLTGNSAGFTGPVNVNGGRLAVNGSLAGGQVIVKSGATLGGNGVIGSLNALSGAIVAPGNSIGTLNVVGNASFGTGSIFQVELASTGQSDLLKVNGAVTVANGALLNITKTDAAPYVLGTHYTVLTAAGGLTGKFATNNVQLTNFIGLLGGSNANSVFFDVALSKTFAAAGSSDNEKATGGALDTLPIGGTLAGAVVNLPTDASAQAAYNLLSGETYASAKAVMLDDSRFIREAVIDRMRGDLDSSALVDADKLGVWGRGTGAWGRMGGNRNAAPVDHDNAGFLMGADALVGSNWRVGVLGGYSQSTLRSSGRQSSGSVDNYSAGLFAGTQWGNVAFRSGLAYTWNKAAVSRTVSFAGFADTLAGTFKANTGQAFGELGYRTRLGTVALEPFANVAYVRVSTDSFAEKGGAAALTGKGDNNGVTYATVGARASSSVMLNNGWNLTARGTVGYRHAFGDTTPGSIMAFADSSAFDITGVSVARDGAVLDVGLDLKVSKTATLGLSYGGQFGSGSSDNTVRASFVVKF